MVPRRPRRRRAPRRSPRGQAAARPWDGRGIDRAAPGPLDLEDLLLLDVPEPVDVAHHAIGQLLELVDLAARLVRAELAVALFLLDPVIRLAADVADLDAGVLH